MAGSHPPALARFGDVALFVLGALMVAAGIFAEADGAAETALIVMGAGLTVLGAFLPRISGTIKITPGSLELTVVQALEATRLQAEREAPDQVEQAVGRAFQQLVESGALAREAPGGRPPTARASSSRRGRLTIVAAVLLVLVAVPVSLTLLRSSTAPAPARGGIPTVPEGSPDVLSPTEPAAEPGTAVVVVAVVVVSIVALVLVLRRRADRRAAAAAVPPPDESPEAFARRIVDEVTGKRD